MEFIALTTAMADASYTIQAAVREMERHKEAVEADDSDMDLTIEECHAMMDTIECQLSYLQQDDSILAVPGLNSEHSGIFPARLTDSELKVAEYWALGTIFYDMAERLMTSPEDIDWDSWRDTVTDQLETVRGKYGRTLAAFAVEVTGCLSDLIPN